MLESHNLSHMISFKTQFIWHMNLIQIKYVCMYFSKVRGSEVFFKECHPYKHIVNTL